MAGLWLVGEVDNHVAIYGSKVAEGFLAFQCRSCIVSESASALEIPLKLGYVRSISGVLHIPVFHSFVYTDLAPFWLFSVMKVILIHNPNLTKNASNELPREHQMGSDDALLSNQHQIIILANGGTCVIRQRGINNSGILVGFYILYDVMVQFLFVKWTQNSQYKQLTLW